MSLQTTKTCIVTGAAGFIGSALVSHLLAHSGWRVIAYDALTYAGNRANINHHIHDPRFEFVLGDICNPSQVSHLFEVYNPDIVFHLAAESHVDRSIDAATQFVTTNVVGTQVLLDHARRAWTRNGTLRDDVRFVHVSTDEVFGDLEYDEDPFTETTPYQPSSPYAASKAASDHMVRAAFRTHGLPVIISNCSNNYGPRQFPEKLIPLMILNALEGRQLPVYGDGSNRRDWLHVEDHAEAIWRMAQSGVPGQTYCVGGGEECSNLDVVKLICRRIDEIAPSPEGLTERLIQFVADRPGHDRRYAIDAGKITSALGWSPRYDFADGLNTTIDWYLANQAWWRAIRDGSYRGERLGLGSGSLG